MFPVRLALFHKNGEDMRSPAAAAYQKQLEEDTRSAYKLKKDLNHVKRESWEQVKDQKVKRRLPS